MTETKKTLNKIINTEEELAYIAGIIDGEGCIFINKRKPKTCKNPCYTLHLGIYNTDEKIITWLKKCLFYGAVMKKEYTNKKYKSLFIYEIAHEKCLDVLLKVYPFMIIKQEQVEIAKIFRKTFIEKFNYNGINQEALNIREKCFTRMKELHL